MFAKLIHSFAHLFICAMYWTSAYPNLLCRPCLISTNSQR